MMRYLLSLIAITLSCIGCAEEEPEIIVLPKNVVHRGDYTISGKNIEISGIVEGDVLAFGSQIFIDGEVKGDVLVAGGNVRVSGNVWQNVRLIGGQAILSGSIGRNVTLVSGNTEFSSSSRVGGNVLAVAGNLELDGSIGGNAKVFASNLRVSNAIAGTLKAYAAQLRLTSKADIARNFEYWSNTIALIDPSARIRGEIVHHPSFLYQLTHSKFFKSIKFGSKFVAVIMNFLYSFVTGILLMYFFYPKLNRSLDMLSNRPIESFIYGLLVLILLPLICLMLIMTILGVPFGLTLLAVNVVGFYTAKIVSILWVVRRVFSRWKYERHKKLYFSLGLVAYFMILSIPYAGALVSLIAMVFGIGAVVLGGLEKKVARKRAF